MARAFFANVEPALPISMKTLTIGGLSSVAILLGACGYADLSVRYLHFDKSREKPNQLAILNLHHDDDELTDPYAIELIRVKGARKGYAVRAPLYETEEGSLHFTVAKQKEFKWFIGLQGRWEF